MLEKQKRKAGKAALAAAVLTFLLTGCAGTPEGSSGDGTVRDSLAETEQGALPESGEQTAGQTDSVKKSLYQGTYRSCILQEDEEYLYLCGSEQIAKINKETNETEILWQSDTVCSCQERIYVNGSGLLLGDRIYFWEYLTPSYSQRVLSCIRTDGTGYERIMEDDSGNEGMLLQDGILHLDSGDAEIRYPVYSDTTLGDRDILAAEDRDGFSSYYDNGNRVCFRGEDTEYLNAYHELSNDLENSRIITADETFIYLYGYEYGEDGIAGLVVEKLNQQTLERSVLLTLEASPIQTNLPGSLMDMVVLNGYLYYINQQDYQYFVMRKAVDGSRDAETVGAPVYDMGTTVLDGVEELHEKRYTAVKPEDTSFVCEIDMVWPRIKEDIPGGAAINACMDTYVESNLSYAEDTLGYSVKPDSEISDDFEQSDVSGSVPSSLSSNFFGMDYVGEHCISFRQKEYDYPSGAAHGMPYWSSFTFDLETGKKLELRDIIDNSEEELRELVTGYFAEQIAQEPGGYWEDALEIVRGSVSLESDFYLNERGIVFYYLPYELSSYSAGFPEVTVPYEEWKMKLEP